MKGNVDFTKGWLNIQYTDLKMGTLDGDQPVAEEAPNKGLMVFFGNIVLPQNFLKSDKKYREGVSYYTKPSNRDITHALTESLSAGIRSALGFGPPTMEQAKKKALEK